MQVFSCEIFEILKNTQFEEHPPPIVSPTANITKIPRFNLFFTWKKKYSDCSCRVGNLFAFFLLCYNGNVTIVKTLFRCSCPKMFCKKGVLKSFAKFTGKRLCQSLFFNKVADFIKKETLTQVFSCEFLRNF